MRVCIIGGGTSGLASIKACLEEGLQPVCYEASDVIGGVWQHSGTILPRVYTELLMNSSREMSSFSDFPAPRNSNHFLSHHEFNSYLQYYARHFKLLPYIRYNSLVTDVHRTGDGAWVVKVKDKETSENFDAVMVCSGRFKKPVMGELKGLDKFEGLVEHSVEFRTMTSKKHAGKDVLVVGSSFTAGDMAALISDSANKVYLSLGESGTTIVSRYCATQNFAPIDQLVLRRQHLYSPDMGVSHRRNLFVTEGRQQVDHEKYNMTPEKYDILSAPFMINDTLGRRIQEGRVEPKRKIERLTKSTVIFEGGQEKMIDYVLMATGYEIDYPFLEKSLLPDKASELELYELVWPFREEAKNLALIGCYSSKQSVFPGIELQARWAARVFSGKSKLPGKETMLAEIRERNQLHYSTSGRTNTLPTYTTVEYQDRLASYISVLPTADRLAETDPDLAQAFREGPAFPYHYRLQGPHAWSGARDASLVAYNIWKRMTGL